MSPGGDDGREMPHGPEFDDEIDAILAGAARDGELAPLSSFVADIRSAGEAVPTPNAALAAALASGISPTVPATATPQPYWRKWKMKLQAFIAGLGVAGKVALGAGIAAAATTGAGAAGILPGPAQHVFANAVETVTPFNVPGGEHHDGGLADGSHDGTTTTTLGDTPTTEHHNGEVVVTPTTEKHETTPTTEKKNETTPTTELHNESTTPTTEHHNESTTPTTEHHNESTTTTTEHHENHNPQALSLNCTRGREPNHVSCSWSWSGDYNPSHHKYVLIRTGGDHNTVVDQTEDGLSFSDTSVGGGVSYTYLVDSLDSEGHVIAHSNVVSIVCCGD